MASREEIMYRMDSILGKFTTVQEELKGMVEDELKGFDVNVEDIDGIIEIDFESEEGDEYIMVRYENVGRTWYFTEVY